MKKALSSAPHERGRDMLLECRVVQQLGHGSTRRGAHGFEYFERGVRLLGGRLGVVPLAALVDVGRGMVQVGQKPAFAVAPGIRA